MVDKKTKTYQHYRKQIELAQQHAFELELNLEVFYGHNISNQMRVGYIEQMREALVFSADTPYPAYDRTYLKLTDEMLRKYTHAT